jgi:O-acetyl-ADP-ribose deacetylase (regulator of RNase III)
VITVVEGNILNATEDIIGHQVNCQGVMGAGLAKQIRNKYPQCYKEYFDYVAEYKHLGLLGEIYYYVSDQGKVIANLFAQEDYGRYKVQTDYAALTQCFKHLHEAVTNCHSSFYNKSVSLPWGIGCGLAGGNLDVVHKIIEEVFCDYKVTLYKLT